jgi:hypothetical protein
MPLLLRPRRLGRTGSTRTVGTGDESVTAASGSAVRRRWSPPWSMRPVSPQVNSVRNNGARAAGPASRRPGDRADAARPALVNPAARRGRHPARARPGSPCTRRGPTARAAAARARRGRRRRRARPGVRDRGGHRRRGVDVVPGRAALPGGSGRRAPAPAGQLDDGVAGGRRGTCGPATTCPLVVRRAQLRRARRLPHRDDGRGQRSACCAWRSPSRPPRPPAEADAGSPELEAADRAGARGAGRAVTAFGVPGDGPGREVWSCSTATTA